MADASNLELCYRSFCGCSRKVLEYMDEHGIAMVAHCLQTEEGAGERLVELGGKAQAPRLVTGGKATCESDGIIAWLAASVA